ncbi:MAG TPA: Clp protease N-terminal domain-containing protein [Candidatus Sulfotelmatobacter sp.]
MFERFTEKARRVIFFARYEACQFGSPRIETEHLLLGILREHKGITSLLPRVDAGAIRKQIESATLPRTSLPASTDLPLSNEGKRVLAYGAEEAERLNHRRIGTEHLLLGLLRDENCFGAKLLVERGAILAELRSQIAQGTVEPFGVARGTLWANRARETATIEIHSMVRNIEQIREAVKRCREYSWHWQKRDLTARDIVVNRKSGAISFDLNLATEDAANFELIKVGWKRKEHCAVCDWKLFESKEDAERGTGYSKGRDWLCNECYAKFWKRADFFSSSYSEIT